MRKHITTREGDVIVAMSNSCIDCIHINTHKGYGHITCRHDGVSKRLGIISNKSGTLLACCSESKTTQLFKGRIDSIAGTIKELAKIRSEIIIEATKTQEDRVNRVIHNLKSINGHYLQELYGLIPQDKFTQNVRNTITIVETAINQDISSAAKMFLRLARLTLSTKAEFSVFEKLMKGNPKLDPRIYNIRDVVMIVLYMFFGDFSDKGIYVDVQDSYEKAKFDFESIQVAFYHIIENAAKYTRPYSRFNITFKKEAQYHHIEFDMESIHVLPHERNLVFNEGYSGANAREYKMSGSGLGMHLIKRLLEINQCMFIPNFDDDVEIEDGIEYSYNKFTVLMPI